MSDYDEFEDMMPQDHGEYDSLNHVLKPKHSVHPEGIQFEYSCPRCLQPSGIIVGWGELLCIAFMVLPQQAGLQPTIYQKNKEDATGFGPSVACKLCNYQHAPLTIDFGEAKHYLDANPQYKRDAIVQQLIGPLTAYAQQRAAAQAQQR